MSKSSEAEGGKNNTVRRVVEAGVVAGVAGGLAMAGWQYRKGRLAALRTHDEAASGNRRGAEIAVLFNGAKLKNGESNVLAEAAVLTYHATVGSGAGVLSEEWLRGELDAETERQVGKTVRRLVKHGLITPDDDATEKLGHPCYRATPDLVWAMEEANVPALHDAENAWVAAKVSRNS